MLILTCFLKITLLFCLFCLNVSLKFIPCLTYFTFFRSVTHTSQLQELVCQRLKGTVSRDFRLLFFFMNQVPQAPEYTIRAVSNFSKIRGYIRSSRCTTGVVDTGGKWKKSSVIKVLIILFRHLWEVKLTYWYIFAFKFTLRSQQPDIVPIICHRCQKIRNGS